MPFFSFKIVVREAPPLWWSKIAILGQKWHFFGKNEGDQRVYRQKIHIYGQTFKKNFRKFFFHFFSFFAKKIRKNEKKLKNFFLKFFFNFCPYICNFWRETRWSPSFFPKKCRFCRKIAFFDQKRVFGILFAGL